MKKLSGVHKKWRRREEICSYRGVFSDFPDLFKLFFLFYFENWVKVIKWWVCFVLFGTRGNFLLHFPFFYCNFVWCFVWLWDKTGILFFGFLYCVGEVFWIFFNAFCRDFLKFCWFKRFFWPEARILNGGSFSRL